MINEIKKEKVVIFICIKSEIEYACSKSLSVNVCVWALMHGLVC